MRLFLNMLVALTSIIVMGILQLLHPTIYQQVLVVTAEEHAVAARVSSSRRVAELTREVLRIKTMLAKHMSPSGEEDGEQYSSEDEGGDDPHGPPAGPSAGRPAGPSAAPPAGPSAGHPPAAA